MPHWLARVILVLHCYVCSGTQEFKNHGMFWSNFPVHPLSISENGVWKTLDAASAVIFTVTEPRKVTVKYHASVEAYRNSNSGQPLPKDVKDTLQMRCLVNGVPYRSSSSYTASYLVETRKTSTLGTVFSAYVPVGTHNVTLQWKKQGDQVREWASVQSAQSAFGAGISLTASTDHAEVWALHETKDIYLVDSKKWTNLTDSVMVTLTQKSTVHVEYGVTVSPAMSSFFIKDRNQEFVSTRLQVGQRAYVEGSLTHGAAAWNPSPGVLSSFASFTLPAGPHEVRLQWKRMGDVFQGWHSRPSFLGGFASSRNIIVSLEKFETPVFQDHTRHFLISDGHWHTVNNRFEVFTLLKESAVHISYALPVTQHGNPNFDSNIWNKLNDIETRVVVDGVGYKHSASSVSGSSRSMDTLFGNLALLLPAGSHSVSLQWRSSVVDWITLNSLDDGFTHSEQLLVVVSSENAKPSLNVGAHSVIGIEDREMRMCDVSVSDIDSRLHAGMKVQLNISVLHGSISLPAIEEYSSHILYDSNVVSQSHTVTGTIAVVNSMLQSMTYIPIKNWSGNDTLSASVSDMGHLGNGGEKTAQEEVEIVINPVDDPFQVEAPPDLVVHEGGTVALGAFELNDIDSDSSVFRSQLSVYCGYLALSEGALAMEGLVFSAGDGIADSILDFQAPYAVMKTALESITYTSRASCNRNQHVEVIDCKFINMDNLDHNITFLVNIAVLPVNNGPEIISLSMPRWSISGLKIQKNADTSSGVFTYLQLPNGPLDMAEPVVVSDDSAVSVDNKAAVSAMGEVSVLYGPNNETFALNLQFGFHKSSVVSYNYIPLNTPTEIIISSIDSELDFVEDSLMCVVDAGMRYKAVVDNASGNVRCTIVASQNEVAPHDRIDWLSISGELTSGISYSSNLMPLFVYPNPVINDFFPVCGYLSSSDTVVLDVTNTQSVEICVFDDVPVEAVVRGSSVSCVLPVIPHLAEKDIDGVISLHVSRRDGLFPSNAVNFSILRDPNREPISVSIAERSGITFAVIHGHWSSEICELSEIPSPLCRIGETASRPFVVNETAVFCELDSTQLSDDNAIVYLQFGNLTTADNIVDLTRVRTPATPSDDFEDRAIFAIDAVTFSSLRHKYFVRVFGGVFPLYSSLKCIFRSADTVDMSDATALSATEIVCVIPQNFSASVVTVSVQDVTSGFESAGFNVSNHPKDSSLWTSSSSESFTKALALALGMDVNSASIELSFSISTISPTIGALSGGESISILGSGFVSIVEKEVSCVFGTAASPAVIMSDTQLICSLPAVDNARVVDVAVTANDIYRSRGSATFTYIDEVLLTSIYPSRGPTDGGTKVVVSGFTFPAVSLVGCIFGSLSTVGRVLNSTAIECESPSGSAGTVSIGISLDGMDVTSDDLKFTYVMLPGVLSVSPTDGGTDGGTKVTVVGNGFSYHSRLGCRFGDRISPAVYVDDMTIRCSSPSHTVGVVSFALSLGDDIWVSTPTIFTYVEEITVSDASPVIGSVNGGTVVTLYGYGFDIADPSAMVCLFGDIAVSATVLSDERIACLSPAMSEPGSVDIFVSGNGVDKSRGSVRFTYVGEAILMSMFPASGWTNGGAAILISGLYFSMKSEVKCFFGSQSLTGHVLTSTTLECVSPPHDAGSVDIQVELDGVMAFPVRELIFSYIKPPSISLLSPTYGSPEGGTVVDIIGRDFTDNVEMTCLFGDDSVVVVYMTSELLRCTSPTHTEGQVNISLVIEGLSPLGLPVPFEYVSDGAIADVRPVVGSVQGGTNVTVYTHGVELVDNSDITCHFGDLEVKGIALSDNRVSCLAPTVLSAGPVDLSIAVNRVDRLRRSAIFTYINDIQLTRIFPRRGSLVGGSTVIISGFYFPVICPVSCIFGSVLVVGRVLNSTAIECSSPPGSIGRVSMGVSLDGLEFISDTISYEYITFPTVETIIPLVGGTDGGTKVTVVGSGFSYDTGVVCNFGGDEVPATMINRTALYCYSPAHTVGVVSLSVRFGDELVVAIPVDFEYVRGLEVSSVYPRLGLVGGGTGITVDSTGLGISDGVSVSCLFGDNEVAATVTSDTTVSCVSPPAFATGSVELALRFNGNDRSSGSATFTYVEEIFLTSLYPQYGGTSGGSTVVIHGSSFPVNFNVLCLFASEPADGRVLNSTSIECELPAGNVGVVSVGVTFDGVMVSSGMLMFTYVKPPVATSIFPNKGSSEGGTQVMVVGSGFFFGENLGCRFGSTLVNAEFINDTALLCIAPAHSVGDVGVELHLGGEMWVDVSQNFTYFGKTALHGIYPSNGPLSGGTVVFVSGEGFTSSDDSSFVCLFGSSTVPGNVVSESTATCVSPSAPQPGPVEVSVSMNGLDYSRGTTTFSYLDQVVLLDLRPRRGCTEGGGTVVFSGLYIPAVSTLKCIFGAMTVAGRILNSTAIECLTPPSHEGKVFVGLSLDGMNIVSESLYFEYISPPVVEMFSPTEGGADGGTEVSVIGSGFTYHPYIACIFGDTSSPATLVDDNSLHCVSPTHVAGEVSFKLYIGDEIWVTAPNNFMFTEEIYAVEIYPAASSVRGGTQITVTGRGFHLVENSSVLCVFGGIDVAATVKSDSILTCVSPSVPSPTRVELKLRRGMTYSSGAFNFSYLAAAEVFEVQHSVGLLATEELVSVISLYGRNFVSTEKVLCSLSDATEVEAVFVSTYLLECRYDIENVELYYGLSAQNFTVIFEDGSVLWQGGISFDSPPHIFDVEMKSPDEGLLYVYVDNVDDFDGRRWMCFVDGHFSDMVEFNVSTFICDVSGVNLGNESVLYVVDVVHDVWSKSYHISGADISHLSSDGFIESMPAEEKLVTTEAYHVHTYHMGWFVNEETFQSKVENVFQRQASEVAVSREDILRNNKNYEMTESSFYDRYSMDTDHCFIEGNKVCFDHNEILYSEESIHVMMPDNDFTRTRMLVIDHVSSRQIDPYDGSWIIVSGRTYSPHSVCILNDATELETTFMSANSLHCFVPPAEEIANVYFLSVVDGVQTSTNSIPLVYDMLDIALKPFYSKVLPSSVSLSLFNSVPEDDLMSVPDVWCATSSGCDLYLPNVTYEQLESVKRSVGRSKLGANIPTHPFNWNELDNVTGVCAGSLASCVDDAYESDISVVPLSQRSSSPLAVDWVGDILYMEPSTIVFNSTVYDLHIFGTFFPSNVSWCSRVDNISAFCIFQSSTEIQCPISSDLSFGQHNVELLINCQIVVDTLPLSVSVPKRHFADNEVDIINIRYPHVDRIRPTSGSSLGGTIVSLEGFHMDQVTACEFIPVGDRTRLSRMVVSAMASQSDVAECVTPPFFTTGPMKLAIFSGNSTWVSISSQFVVFRQPEIDIAYMSGDSDHSTHHVHVIGRLFDGRFKATCRISYTDNSTLVIMGKVFSTEIVCSDHTFWSYDVVDVAVSFNGVDYVDANFQSEWEDFMKPNFELSVNSELYEEHVTRPANNAKLRFPVQPKLETTYFRTSVCDGTQELLVTVTDTTPFDTLRCMFTPSGAQTQANLISLSTAKCVIPSLHPGSHLASLMIEDGDSWTSLVQTDLQCAVQPSIFSVSLDPRSPKDGSHSFYFIGLNLMTSLKFVCSMDNEFAPATVLSSRSVMCTFPATNPGIKTVGLSYGITPLYSTRSCVTDKLLRVGGTLSSTTNRLLAECIDEISEPSAEVVSLPVAPISLERDVILYWPRMGTTAGRTAIEIIGDGMEPMNSFTCRFGSTVVPAFLIERNQLLCYSPPKPPSVTTLVVNSSSGDSWLCGEFAYVSMLKIQNISTTSISHPGDVLIRIRVADVSAIRDSAKLYCHIGDEVVAAHISTDTLVTCVSYFSSGLLRASLSLGSEVERWSDPFEFTLAEYVVDSFSVTPTFGSVQGGTPVSVRLPILSVLSVSNLVCKFNGLKSPSIDISVNESSNMVAMTCLSPPSNPGRFLLSVEQIALDDTQSAITLATTVYSYERSPEVVKALPERIMQGLGKGNEIASVQIFLQGANFKDSKFLGCVVNEWEYLSARWHSQNMVSCEIPSALTTKAQTLKIQITNNGVDVSSSSVSIAVTSRHVVSSISPRRGYTSGGTMISIALLESVPVQLFHCVFGSSIVRAARTASGEYVCISPALQAGVHKLDVVIDEGVVESIDFEYVEIPSSRGVTPSVVLASHRSTINVHGIGFDDGTVGRFRKSTGEVRDAHCHFIRHRSLLECEVIPGIKDVELFFDVSSNGVHYVSGFAVVKVVSSSKVLSFDVPATYMGGGAIAHFKLYALHSVDSLLCNFKSLGDDSVSFTSHIMYVDENHVTCSVPAMPIGQSWLTLSQLGHTIFGPEVLNVLAEPSVSTIHPMRIQAGQLTPLLVSFSTSGGVPQDMDCILDNVRYSLRQLSTYVGICNVQPLVAGAFDIALAHAYSLNKFDPVYGQIIVTNGPEDVVANTSALLNFRDTAISFRSHDCALPSGTMCMQDGVERVPISEYDRYNDSTGMLCEVVCVMPAQSSHHLESSVVSLFSRGSADSPFFTRTIKLLRTAAISGRYPQSATTLGGTLVTVIGTGFADDASLECAFGDIVVPAVFISQSKLTCVSPTSPPGIVPLNIRRSEHVISKSNFNFEFTPPLAVSAVSVHSVFSLGGSEVQVSVAHMDNMYQYQCKFTDVLVGAAPINATTLLCVSPPLSYDVTDLCITANGAVVSAPVQLTVVRPPSVLFVDPVTVPSNVPVTFMIILSDAILPEDYAFVECTVGNSRVMTKTQGSMMECFVPDIGLPAGNHELSVSFHSVKFYSVNIHARTSITISRVTPQIGFSLQQSTVVIQTISPISDYPYAKCCFDMNDDQDPFLSQAVVVGPNQWECLSPMVENNTTRRASVGVSGPDGVCEYSSFSFSFVPLPSILSVSPVVGPLTGGTVVTIVLSNPIDIAIKVYCRIGSQFFLSERDSSRNVKCITRAAPASEYPIELSVNGVNFFSIGYSFEYQLLSIVDNADDLRDADDLRPVIYRMSPSTVGSTRPEVIRLFGTGFVLGTYCLMDNSFVLSSNYVSESEIQCTTPVHVPGYVNIIVADPSSGLMSDSMELLFVSTTPHMDAVAAGGIYPEWGPRRGGTVVTIFGSSFDTIEKSLLCMIGEDWVFASIVSPQSVKCITPPNSYSGKVHVRLATDDGEFIPGMSKFEYIEDPLLFDCQPHYGTVGTLVQIVGKGFNRNPKLECSFGDVLVDASVISDTVVTCTVPHMPSGVYSVTLRTNGQQFVRSGLTFDNLQQAVLDSLSPVNGPALRGNTMLTIHGSGFPEVTDIYCVLGEDYHSVPAIVLSENMIRCRMPSHRPGRVNITVVAEGTRLHAEDNFLEFVFTPDVSVDKITPEFGYTSGGFPVFVFGSNFINTTFLGCRFGDMESRGIFLSNTSIVCLAPSPLGRSELSSKSVYVEVTVNGVDYSESYIEFDYSEPCDEGWFCPGMTRQLCPNGTYCPINSRNFTLCPPGSFQPKEGQVNCANCPVGYICPDHGMTRPVVCPPGQICDTQGLRASGKNCPMGHYCLNGTKASSASDFLNNSRGYDSELWSEEYVTGVVKFNASAVDWSYTPWEFPAVGKSRPNHPPEPHCDGMVCTPGSLEVIAEAPFPCPIGHYCRAGVGAQFPIPKNFSTPQRCFDGFFCSRGSINPEGQGPCPTGYFCPTQLDAIICPRGHYCPGVGNRGPIECYPGTFNPSEGRSNCTVCPTGHVCPGWGSLLPELCPAGFVCSALGLSYPVVLCPAGYICRDGTLTLDPADPTDNKPEPCAAGTFCLGGVSRTTKVPWIPTSPWGAQTPQACSEGTYCKSGAYEPSGSGQCFRGHYCPPDLDFPIETPIGNFASEEGSVAPTLCFPGTYAPLKAQVDCLPCPAGHSCQSYGTYVPSICGVGTFRSLVDSVTCRLCITGTYSDEVGAVDISMCLPCPEGRVCGIQGIYSLSQSTVCPAGYICGYGTDRTRQFSHRAPAGYHTTAETIPSEQYDSVCSEGFYCVRGTSTALSLRAKCGVGYYCPAGTSTAAGQEVKCPRVTTSLSGVNELLDCRISDVDVCDKAAYDLRYPMQDLTYYPSFEYTLLDGSETVKFDSSTTALNPTGEVVVVEKVYSINESASSAPWVNDTVEAFRTCPSYGNADTTVDNIVTVIGRNFLNNGNNYCRWRKCFSADLGALPRQCKNRGLSPDGEDLPIFGEVGEETVVTLANWISPTRMECTVPKFVFEPIEEVTEYMRDFCKFINEDGETVSYSTPHLGNLSYVRKCDEIDENCLDLPEIGENFYQDLVVKCTYTEETEGYCSNIPEPGYMYNPCFTHQVMVEVSNDGFRYSTGDDLQGTTINATVLPPDKRSINYVDWYTPPTAAVYTFIMKEYFPRDSGIYDMEKDYCTLARYSEESKREREQGWFLLRAQDVAHIHTDLKHLPEDMVYGEHYRFALFITPSRCTEEVCNSNRVRLTPQENTPCKLPAEFSSWFMNEEVPKNTANNITVYALEDIIFKFEIHIMVGLYAPYAPFLKNTTTVRIASPSRARIVDGVKGPTTRTLSPYVSYEERVVTKQYFFAVAYSRDNADSISYPLNLPPRGEDYKLGRALISYNSSNDAVDVPDVLDDYADISIGSNFWDSPASTADESKEIYDAHFETFHGMQYSGGSYDETFTQILVPYLLFFSNCRQFDSYIPLWLLFEGKECSLPDEESVGEDWPRFAYDPLPNQDHVKVVGPWDFFQDPVADWCERSLTCNYEEVLDTLDVVPRWFEASSGDELFSVIREPITYGQFAGRSGPRISENDAGGTDAIDAISAISSDLFKGVVVDREAANDFPGGCSLGCFPRSMTLDIGYYQYDVLEKRLIYINLVFDEFDTNTEDTHYDVDVLYYPLGYFDLLIYFAFDVEIFIILFIFIGGVTVVMVGLYWVVVRLTTSLQNPPELKIYSMFTLVAPPPAAGVTLALIPVVILTGLAYYLISGDRLTDPAAEVGGWILDEYQLEYVSIGGRLDPEEQERARSGRLGLAFVIIAFMCCFVGTKIFLPKKVSKRENELALKRDKMAEKESIWAPTLWKRSNLMFASLMMGVFLVFIVEFSFWGDFGTYLWYIIFMLKVFAKFIDALVDHQLKEALLSTPVQTSLVIIQGLVTLGADDFVDFLLSYFVELALLVLERVYVEPYLEQFLEWFGETMEWLIKTIKAMIPSYLWKKKKDKEKKELDYRKRDVDDDIGDDDAETVEPILDSYSSVCQDTMAIFYTPFLIWLLMQFRTELVLPELYGIAEQDMLYYLYFSLVIIFFMTIADILLHSVLELFHGWKIYEYLVYTRYRFLQRETRWKGMETSLDECIDETMRTLDQMCFSSQFYLMLTIHCNGILYVVLGIEMMLRAEYNAFADTALIIIVLYLIACYIVLERFTMWFVMKIKLWKIKHENTAWHLQIEDDDDLDVPGWEDVKGASHDAYLMNQRITSETFRYKFLNYNRAWLIQQLPQLLTPRTLRRSRPYLINQFARIINSRRDDISDDSDAEREKRFGPVALQAQSRNIIRFWLDKARRRLRLKHIVEPLIRRARGAECEQCLSRKQLQVEYEVDIDQMIKMYENMFPSDVEIDQVQWKTFWMRNQHYHTICMACIAQRKDKRREAARQGRPELANLDDEVEEYPDWGPVFLSAASKAILLNWYRKAQQQRALKKSRKKKEKQEKKVVSDDEADETPKDWVNQMAKLTPATKAIAVKWMRTARAKLQKKAGKGGSIASGKSGTPALSDNFRSSGNKSKMRKK